MLSTDKLSKSEEQIKNGEVIKANTKMSDEEIDDLLRKDVYNKR